jgi:hypothetical protein
MDGGKKTAGKRWIPCAMRGSAVVLIAVAAVCAAVWHWRVGLATRAVGRALDAQGLGAVSFRLTGLSPWRTVVEDIRWDEGTETLLAVDRVEAHFSLDELRRRHVERIHVQGVRTTLLARDGNVVSPLAERVKTLAEKAGTGAAASGGPPFSIWMATVRDVRVNVISAENGEPVAALTLGAGGVAESAGRYRVWGQAEVLDAQRAMGSAQGTADADGRLAAAKVTGSVVPGTGAVAVAPVLEIKDIGGCLALAQRLMPGVLPDAMVEAQSSLTARGEFAVTGWTNLAPFSVSAELGRGSRFAVPSKSAAVQFQSLRVEASGTLHDIQGRVNAGVSGFSVGKGVEASQETGRMLSARASARFSQSATNQAVTVALESDLPGRSIAMVLPRVMPLVPVFFSDGGTLRVDAEVARPLAGAWLGRVRYAAEALRSSVPLAGAYVGARAVRVAGEAAVAESRPGAVLADITLEGGYYFRDGMTVKGGGEAHLVTRPPYAEAEGTFKGQAGETRALALALKDAAVPFEGKAVVTSLASNPVWRIAARVPEFRVAWTQQAARVTGTVGGAADVRYSASGVAAHGGAWARELEIHTGAATNPTPLATVGRIGVAFDLPEVDWAGEADVAAEATFDVSNVWAGVKGVAELEDARCVLPFRWSKRDGLAFRAGQSLAWRRLAAQDVTVTPDGFVWSADGEAVEARIGARVEGSAVRAEVLARVPLTAPEDATLVFTLPETVIGPDDVLAARVRDKVGGAEVAGRVSVQANVRFLGTQPHVSGCVRLSEGSVRVGKAEVEGLAAEVPFLGGVIFRTVERPFVSFERAKMDNIRFDRGRLDFQVTRRGVLVDRLEIGYCKGSLNAYSVQWDFKNPKDDFVVYADRIDLGEALMMVVPFKGSMKGVLFGRLPVGIDQGKVKLSTGFLYSLPGQGGAMRLDDNRQMLSLLDQAGVKGDVQLPLSKALSDMDFSMLRLELEPKLDGEGTLRIKLVGKSNDKAWPAPVDLNLNLHGPLEKLVNMGLDLSRK